MRHLVKGRKLSRTSSHRKATMQSLASALIEHKAIRTTVPKAKELRRFIEPLITRSKTDSSHNRRQVFSSLQEKHSVTELFEEIGPAVGDRPGGYTRILKLGFRQGDSTEMALIELVDFSDYEPESKEKKKKKTRRAGKSNKPVTEAKESKEKTEAKESSEEDAPKEEVEVKKAKTDIEESEKSEDSKEKKKEAKKEPAKKKEEKSEEVTSEEEPEKKEDSSDEEKK